MNVLIIGFDDYNELNYVMNDLIEKNGVYLFNVVCGGMDLLPFRPGGEYVSLGHEWAEKNGAPIIWICKYTPHDTIDDLMAALLKETDYLVIKMNDKTPQIWKNFLMKLKMEGKHGTVIREN